MEWDSAKAVQRDLIGGIIEGFLATDAQFLETARRKGLTSGTTACVVIIQDRTLYCANLGDSRAVLCRKRKALPLSEDQNTSSVSEQERVVKDGGYIMSDGEDDRVGGVLCVTRAVGDFDDKKKEKLCAFLTFQSPSVSFFVSFQVSVMLDSCFVVLGTGAGSVRGLRLKRTR